MNRLLVVFLSLCVIFSFSSVSNANPVNYAAFSPASFYGVTLTPSFATGVLDYTFALSPTGQIKIGSTFFDLLWIQGVFVVGATSADTFIATDGTGNPSGWTWDASPVNSPYNVAGWVGNAEAVRINQGESKTFHYGSLDFGNPPVPTLVGLHVGYSAPGGSPVTAFFKGNIVPEPSSLFGLGTALVGVFGIYSRRRNRKN